MIRFLPAALVLFLAGGAASGPARSASPPDSSPAASRPAEAGPLASLLLSNRSAEAAELLEAYRRATPEGELQGVLCRVGALLVAQGLSAPTANDRLRGLDAHAPLQLGVDTVQPRVLDHPSPLYTPEARRARVQGVVILQLVVATTGEVLDAKVMKGLPMGLSEKALEAVRQWRFEPVTLEGSPVPSCFAIDVEFRLPAAPDDLDGGSR